MSARKPGAARHKASAAMPPFPMPATGDDVGRGKSVQTFLTPEEKRRFDMMLAEMGIPRGAKRYVRWLILYALEHDLRPPELRR